MAESLEGISEMCSARLGTVYGVKVSEEGSYDPDRIYEALEWCVRNNMHIANISSGTPMYKEKIQNACRRANKKGLLIIAAAGNYVTGATFPASYLRVISVGSIDKNKQRSEFSCIWPTTDISAPGEEIFGAASKEKHSSGYATCSGTSMSTPHVTGILSLGISYLKKRKKEFTPKLLEDILEGTALKPEYEERKMRELIEQYAFNPFGPIEVPFFIECIYGKGIVDAANFMESLRSL